MQSVLDAALERAGETHARRINRLRMRVGALTGVVPEALQFAFEALREGTLAAEAQLDIQTVAVRCWCEKCQAEFEPEDALHDCPECGRASGETRAGLELELTNMEIE